MNRRSFIDCNQARVPVVELTSSGAMQAVRAVIAAKIFDSLNPCRYRL